MDPVRSRKQNEQRQVVGGTPSPRTLKSGSSLVFLLAREIDPRHYEQLVRSFHRSRIHREGMA